MLAQRRPRGRCDRCSSAPTRRRPTARSRGFALGVGLLIVAFEFEYATHVGRPNAGRAVAQDRDGQRAAADALRDLRLPAVRDRRRGLYRERLGAHTETSVAPNTGGGVKVSLAGPLRLRVDYRVFKLGSGALYSPAHRVYAGLNLKF